MPGSMRLPSHLNANVHAPNLIEGRCYAHIRDDIYPIVNESYVLLGKFVKNNVSGRKNWDQTFVSHFSGVDGKPVSIQKSTYLSFYREIESCEQEEVDRLNREIVEFLAQEELNKKANAHAAKQLEKKYQPLFDIIKTKLSAVVHDISIKPHFTFKKSLIDIDFSKGPRFYRIQYNLKNEKVYDASMYRNFPTDSHIKAEIKIVKDTIQELKENSAKGAIGSFITETGRRPPNANTHNSGGLLYKLAAKNFAKTLRQTGGRKTKNGRKNNRKTRKTRKSRKSRK